MSTAPSELPAPKLPECFRHPGRETGRSCTRCGRPACPDCLHQVSVGSQCTDCLKASRPDVRTRARWFSARQPALVAYTLIGINVGVFVLMAAADPDTLRGRVTSLHVDLGLNKDLIALDDSWYRLITSGFIHFGIIHLAFNMLVLFQLGNLLEPAIGRLRFALVYVASLLGGSALVLMMEGSGRGITGGASGAVFGLALCAAVGMTHRGINIFQTGLGPFLAINFLITFTLSGVSVGGHLGGSIAGAICGVFVMAPQWKGYPAWTRIAAPILVALAAVAVSVVAVG